MSKTAAAALVPNTARRITIAGALALSLSAGGAAAQDMEAGPACYLHSAHTENGDAMAGPSPDSLEDAYDCFESHLLSGYAQSKHVIARIFGEWERDSYAPFKNEDVGARYLVVYGNDRAVGEESTLWLDRDLPIGAMVAAAGFSVAEDGKLVAEPLMIYEKMTQGYSFGRGNWRQTMIAPNGDILGVTKGPGADALTVCQDCAARSADRLYLALLNDGTVPAGAPEPSAPITDNELTDGGETLDPGAVLEPPGGSALDPLAPLSPLDGDIPKADTFDPNATLDPNTPLDPLAPLEPSEPLDPNAPLDPLAPLESSDSMESDATPMIEQEPSRDTASTDSKKPESEESIGEMPSDDTDVTEAIPPLNDPTKSGSLTGLDLELSEATDPLLPIPQLDIDPPPFLEDTQNGAGI